MKIQSNADLQAYLLDRVTQEPGGCWLWTRAVDRAGYGLAWANGGRHRAARLSFMVFVGPVPRGHEIRHTCPNRRCINPHHLQAKKHGENMRLHAAAGTWRGERNSKAKLSENDVLAIKILGPWVKAQTLADDFQISIRSIYNILAGRTWPHVEVPKLPPRSREEVLEYGRAVMQKAVDLCVEIRQECQQSGTPEPPHLAPALALAEISLAIGL